MNQTQSKQDGLSVQWVNKKENNYLVKFKKIEVPIEMNKVYFNSILKHLKN